MQQQQTGLGRDQHPDFVGDFLSAATLEPLFREKDLNMALQFLTIRRRKPRIQWITAHQKIAPCGRERAAPNPVPASFF
jgi:hypothetical protein